MLNICYPEDFYLNCVDTPEDLGENRPALVGHEKVGTSINLE